MAQSVDPLQRAAIRVQAQDTGDRFAVPTTNRTLQLAAALGEFAPSVRVAGEALASSLRDKAQANAQRDAIANGGTELADAQRQGLIHPTQNPWYVSAYRRESAALRTQTALHALQLQSATWAEQNDPEAFARKWQQGVHDIAGSVGSDEDSARGFVAAEAPITNQTIASNVSQRAHSMEQERVQNVSALAAQSLADGLRQRGGSMSPNDAYAALTPARTRWFATGGSLDDWNAIQTQAIATAAESTATANFVDIGRAPELLNGPSEAGATPMSFRDVEPNHPARADSPHPGAIQPVALPASRDAPPATGEAPAFQPGAEVHVDEAHSEPAIANHPPAPAGTVAGRSYLPVMGAVTGRFGERRNAVGGGYRAHGGMDLAVPVGTHLVAPQVTGHAVFSGDRGNYGNLVEVQYGNGVSLRVAHLSGTSVQAGDDVPPGALLGLSGGRRGAPGAGNATGPHVHYEVRRNGVAVDPRTVTFTNYSGPAGQQEAQAGADAPLPSDAPAIAPPADGAAQEPAVADIISRGPSLYDISGNAASLEGVRYRVSSSIRSQAQDRLQAEVATRRLAGMQAEDQLWNRYGTRLLTGNFDRNTIIQELTAAHYAPQAIAEALNLVNAATHDGAGIAEAQVAAHSSTPEEARELLDVAADGRLHGYTPEYQARVGRLVVAGRITGQAGEQMVAGAISRSQALEAEDKADRRQALADAARQNPINNYSQLNDRAEGLAEYAIAQAARMGEHFRQGIDAAHSPRQLSINTIRGAMNEWLGTHPNDWAGAERAGRQRVARLLRALMIRSGHATAARPNYLQAPR